MREEAIEEERSEKRGEYRTRIYEEEKPRREGETRKRNVR